MNAEKIPSFKKELVLQYLTAGLLLGAGIITFIVYRSFAWSMFIAALFYIGFEKPYQFLLRIFRGRRTLAASVSMILILSVIFGPVLFLMRYVIKEAILFVLHFRDVSSFDRVLHYAKKLPFLIDMVTAEQFFWINMIDTLSGFLKKYGRFLDPEQLGVWIEDAYSFFLISLSFTLSLADIIFFGIILLFFMLRDGPSLYNKILHTLPFPEDILKKFIKRLREMIYAVLKGSVFVSLLQGVMLGLGLFFVGIPSSVLYGTIAAFFSLIPIVGTAVVWLPASLYLAFVENSYGYAIFIALYGLGMYFFLENVFKPKFLNSRLGVHSVFLFFAIIGGLKEFGISGIILGPVFVSLFATLWSMYQIWETEPDTNDISTGNE